MTDRLKKLICKLLGHKPCNEIVMNGNGVMADAIVCQRCDKIIEITSKPFIATE